MTTVTIEEAQVKLPELVAGLAPGDELAIIHAGRIVARIVGEGTKPVETNTPSTPSPREPGSAEDKILWASPELDHQQPEVLAGPAGDGQARAWPSQAGSGKTAGFWMAPDFDEPLEEFRESMESWNSSWTPTR